VPLVCVVGSTSINRDREVPWAPCRESDEPQTFRN
jgi:hypothetical protein